MAKAFWNDILLAESEQVLLVEGRVYFPPESIVPGALRPSVEPKSYCHWKGDASYFDVIINSEVNHAAAWSYATPYDEAVSIAGYFAFWKGIRIEDKPDSIPLSDPGGSLGSRTGFRALCWLLERSTETSLSAAEVEAKIGVSEKHLASTFEHPSVQAFAKHLKWELVDGVLHNKRESKESQS